MNESLESLESLVSLVSLDPLDSLDTRSAPRDGRPERSAGIPARRAEPDPQVRPRATRRRFSLEYRERIDREADVVHSGLRRQ